MSRAKRMPNKRDRIIGLFAKLLAGIQVPMSIGGPRVLGAAYDPIVELRKEVDLFGYPQAKEIEQKLKEALS